MIRQAVILAAGRGSRMKRECVSNLTLLNTPKPLLKVHGVPIVERIVRKLTNAGLEVAIVVNPSELSTYKECLFAYDIKYYYEKEPLGTGHAVMAARQFIKDELFLVMMGDDLSKFDMWGLIHINEPTIFGFKTQSLEDYGALILNEYGYVKEVLEKSVIGNGIANTGIYILPKSYFGLFNKIKPNRINGEYYLTDIVNLFWEHGNPLHYKELNFWKGVNTKSDFTEANNFHLREVVLRKVAVSDLFDLLELLNELSPVSFNWIHSDKSRSEEKLKFMLRADHIYMIVAEYRREIIGTATLYISQNLTHNARPFGHIENVVTSYEMRGKGIGSMMLRHLKEVANQYNCYKLLLNCRPGNVAFYESNGFRKTGEIEMRINL